MKNVKKILKFLALGLVLMLTLNDNVYAADYAWPGVNFTKNTPLPKGWEDMNYCVYETQKKVIHEITFELNINPSDFEWYFGENNFYSNTSFVFIHNPQDKTIRFVGYREREGVPSNWTANWNGTSEYEFEIVSRYKNYDVTSLEELDEKHTYVWHTEGDDQKFSIDVNLYNYLVDENGKLECKPLYFLEVDNNKSLWGSDGMDGNLTIYGDSIIKYWEKEIAISQDPNDPYFEFYMHLDPFYRERNIKNLKFNGIRGTLKLGGLDKMCTDALSKIEELENKYFSSSLITTEMDEYIEISNQDSFTEEDVNKAIDFYNRYGAFNSEIQKSLEDVVKGFDINRCKNVNDVKSRIDDLNETIEHDISQVDSRKETIKITVEDDESISEAKKEELIEATENVDKILKEFEKYLDNFNTGTPITSVSCEGILGPALLDDISLVLTYVRIAVPILVIVLGSVDFAKAVLSDDQQELKKAGSKFLKRCIVAIAIFFAPSLIMYILSFIDKIYDVSCNIRLW